jgi:ATP-binding cassette subfamily F protein 3
MIQFENATKLFGGETVLDSLSFKINKGERCGLVGRNGSGKTTLLRLIAREEDLDGGLIEMPKGYSLGYLTQHLRFSKPTLIEEAAQDLAADAVYKVEKILFGLGFKEKDLSADPLVFSGGYQLRIHLAKVLAREPDCLLLDEPTNYLDIVSIRWIKRFLKNWPGEFILISHDRDFMDQVTTHTLGIHRKKVKKLKGGTQKFYEQILQEEEVHERTRLNLEKKRTHVESFITRFGGKATKAAQAQSRKKQLARMPVLEELAKIHHLDFRFPYAPFPGKRLLEAKGVEFSYEEKESGSRLSEKTDGANRLFSVCLRRNSSRKWGQSLFPQMLKSGFSASRISNVFIVK